FAPSFELLHVVIAQVPPIGEAAELAAAQRAVAQAKRAAGAGARHVLRNTGDPSGIEQVGHGRTRAERSHCDAESAAAPSESIGRMVGGIFYGRVAARGFHDREILADEVLACRPEPSVAGSLRPSQKREPRPRASVGEPSLAFLEDWERSPRGVGQTMKSPGSRTQVVYET